MNPHNNQAGPDKNAQNQQTDKPSHQDHESQEPDQSSWEAILASRPFWPIGHQDLMQAKLSLRSRTKKPAVD